MSAPESGANLGRDPASAHRSSLMDLDSKPSTSQMYPQRGLIPSILRRADHALDQNVSTRTASFAASTHASASSRLTLSAFRKPQETVRLTNADPCKRLQDEYDMRAPGCGVLGHGAYSTVRLACRKRDGMRVAIKSIAKYDALRSHRLRQVSHQHYLEEWEILRRMHHHPYVIDLLGVYETHEEIQLVLEYCPGGELFNAIQKKRNRSHAMRWGQYTESQAAHIISQILWALRDLHAQGIVHRDIKPENILIIDSNEESTIRVKLCDFGMARLLSNSAVDDNQGDVSPMTPTRRRAYSMVGSDYYVAPEVSYGAAYDTAVDLYSLGVTLYILLSGVPPVFEGSDNKDGQVVFPNSYWKDISQDAKDMIKKLLDPDPETRLSAADALQEPWMERYSQDALSPRRVPPTTRSDHQLNLDLVRSRLHRSMGAMATSPLPQKCRDRHFHSAPAKRSKRMRAARRASDCLMALADLYRETSTPAKTHRPAPANADESRDPPLPAALLL